MGSFRAFEINLKQRKKEKTIAFRSTQEKAKVRESHGDDEEDELALLTKNFHKFLKKAGKQTKYGVSGSKVSKGKNSFKPLYFSNKKCVQSREWRLWSYPIQMHNHTQKEVKGHDQCMKCWRFRWESRGGWH